MRKSFYGSLAILLLLACQPKTKPSSKQLPPVTESPQEETAHNPVPVPPVLPVSPEPQPTPDPSPRQPEGVAPLWQPVVNDEPRLLLPFQYWLLEKRGGRLSFNSAWDDQAGAAMIEDPNDPSIQDYSHRCASSAEAKLRALLMVDPMRSLWEEIGDKGGSRDLLIVVNQAPSGTQIRELLALDRGPDLWFWNKDRQRPQLVLAKWSQGSFVYEVAATPENCFEPSEEKVNDFLQYAAKRLSRRKPS